MIELAADPWKLELLPVPELTGIPDPAPGPREFALMEAIWRLSGGMAHAWADRAAAWQLARNLRAMNPAEIGWTTKRLHNAAFAQMALVDGGEPLRPWRGQRQVMRLTHEGLVEHYAWRAELLPKLERPA